MFNRGRNRRNGVRRQNQRPQQYQYDKTCPICEVHFTTTNKYAEECINCINIRKFLGVIDSYTTPNIDPELFYPGLKLKIIWIVDETVHDGYCSDAGEYSSTTDESAVVYPLLKSIKNSDIDTSGRINNYSKLKMYQRPNSGCSRGSGYNCHGGTSYSIESAKVIRDVDIITLDD